MGNYKVKTIWIIASFLLVNFHGKSQEDTVSISRNALFLEAGGIGGYGSLKYERSFPIKEKFNLAARIGISTYNLRDFTNKFNPDIIIPISISGLYGDDHKFEFGLGNTISGIIVTDPSDWKPNRETQLHANFTIGYRYQKDSGGLIFRCSYSPLFEFYQFYRHWAGLSFGYVFLI